MRIQNLLRCKVLVRTEVVDVLELRRSRRQVARGQEQDVEVVVTSRRAVHRGAALECAGVVFRVIHADQRAVIVQGLVPTLQISEEVVQPSIGSEVLANASPAWDRKGNILSARDRHAVIHLRGGNATAGGGGDQQT